MKLGLALLSIASFVVAVSTPVLSAEPQLEPRPTALFFQSSGGLYWTNAAMDTYWGKIWRSYGYARIERAKPTAPQMVTVHLQSPPGYNYDLSLWEEGKARVQAKRMGIGQIETIKDVPISESYTIQIASNVSPGNFSGTSGFVLWMEENEVTPGFAND
ncbi:hypothetical protein [Paenibacillus xanthanilyticus]|uniref:Uncharacterized protein n=1 Tax=Paenibacillus xanthanilyticus TaxID=1783531 RepID=A0ABV8JXQ1_9BACL